jgi:hypothetical protein
MLLWNFQPYIYDFRITRLFSFLFAGFFDLFYIMVLAKTFDLIIFNAKEANPIDVVSAVIHAFLSVFFAPTFYVNSLIFLKELTMNQEAWNGEEDYPAGYALNGWFNIDILYWLDIEEDPEYYKENIKQYTT